MQMSEEMKAFVTESSELLQEMEATLLRLEEAPDDQELVGTIFRVVHTLKGSAAIMGFEATERFSHALEALLHQMREGTLGLTPQLMEILLSAKDLLSDMTRNAATGTETTDNRLLRREQALTVILGDHLKSPPPAVGSMEPGPLCDNTDAESYLPDKAPAQALDRTGTGTNTLRVDAGRVDSLVDLVSELLSATSVVEQLCLSSEDGRLVEAVTVLSGLMEDLRARAMKMRMVPVGESFSRLRRVVRDLARDLGKSVEFEIQGGETELDRTMIEKLQDPLMHIIRNAVDHGIESPEERTESGKFPFGTIRLNAAQDADGIIIEVSDDGRGIDLQKIRLRAAELGLVRPEHEAEEPWLLSLVFRPGFSTAQEVTRLSGRGVGMDVVGKNIQALRGTVSVGNSEGNGTSISIRLPLTLAVIHGFLVRVAETPYILPLDFVTECLDMADTGSPLWNGRPLALRGALVPCSRLRDIFCESGALPKTESVVIVRQGADRIGLVVDLLLGGVQAVVKPLGRMHKAVEEISGAAVLGDGTVALIIDIPRLLNAIKERYN